MDTAIIGGLDMASVGRQLPRADGILFQSNSATKALDLIEQAPMFGVVEVNAVEWRRGHEVTGKHQGKRPETTTTR